MRQVLSDLHYKEGGRYRITLTADLIVDLRLHLRGFHILQDRGRTYAVSDDDQLTIRAGYACDGCSPAFRLGGRWFGVPTPRRAVVAAVVHDCLRGYMGLRCMRYTRQDTDEVFRALLKEEGFALGEVYHAAVAGPAGRLYHYLTKSTPTTASCRCHPMI